jgi:hypothetical protein
MVCTRGIKINSSDMYIKINFENCLIFRTELKQIAL